MGKESKRLLEKARRLIPGGVNSPVRAGKSVGIDPPFIEKAEGCFLWDVEGKQYIDYVCSWGPMTALEVEMAETITEMIPSIEMVRMVNSGTEATMSAIRLARGYTGRDKIIKFEGCYHGHADSLLVSAGSGMATLVQVCRLRWQGTRFLCRSIVSMKWSRAWKHSVRKWPRLSLNPSPATWASSFRTKPF